MTQQEARDPEYVDLDDTGNEPPPPPADNMVTDPETVQITATTIPTFTEAPGIAWTEVYGKTGGHVMRINLTSRANTPQEALDQLMKTIAYGMEAYKLKPYNPNERTAPAQNLGTPGTKPAPVTPAPVAQPATPGTATPPPPVTTPASAPATTSNGGIMDIVKIDCTPVANGKSKLLFYAAGHQYADLTALMTPDQLAVLMQPTGAWTHGHFAVAAVYNVNCKVEWKASDKMNSKGNPYKNIVRVMAA